MFSATTTLSRSSRAFELRRMMPEVTRQPAMLPTFDDRKIARISARPSSTSSKTGLSMPLSALSISSMAW